MANQFYIDPTAGRNPQAFQGLSTAIQGYGAEQRRQQGVQQQAGWEQEAAALYESGDLDALAAFAIKHPELGESVRTQSKYKSDATEAIRRDMLRKIVIGGGDYKKIITEGAEKIKSLGGDPSETLTMLDETPEGALEIAEKLMALSGNGDWKNIQEYRKSKAGGDPKKQAETRKLVSEAKLLEQKFKDLSDNQTPTEDRIKIEKDLRKEVYDRSKVFQDVDDAWTRVQVSAKDPSPAGDMALIFNYMKMLDPGSTVREGEFATAQQTGSVDDRIVSLYNQIITGTRLSAPQRADFTKRAKSLYRAAESKNKKMTAKYKALAKRYNVDPVNVVLDSAELTDDDLVNKYL